MAYEHIKNTGAIPGGKHFKYKELNFKVPHIELTSRNFVLFPLQEILPNWKHPKTKETISTLIQKLPGEDVKSILKVKKN